MKTINPIQLERNVYIQNQSQSTNKGAFWVTMEPPKRLLQLPLEKGGKNTCFSEGGARKKKCI